GSGGEGGFMGRLFACVSMALVLVLAACGPAGGGGPDSAPKPLDDRDGDSIADIHEGCDEGRDTDGAGTTDCVDLDSDGDGIPDSVEAGDSDVNTPPVDSDGDGTPDFMDLDSDNNGIPDAVEGANDLDGDGIGDYADFDNDGDTLPDVLEIGGDP